MTRYEETFDTDWETLDADEATQRSYAIGVAEKLGEYNREHLERVYAEMETAYEKSVVELAYEEGRKEATAAVEDGDHSGDTWAELVEGEQTVVEGDDLTRGRDGLPEALDKSDVLDRLEPDSTEATDKPGFLDR